VRPGALFDARNDGYDPESGLEPRDDQGPRRGRGRPLRAGLPAPLPPDVRRRRPGNRERGLRGSPDRETQ
jgi:hypothetical protein